MKRNRIYEARNGHDTDRQAARKLEHAVWVVAIAAGLMAGVRVAWPEGKFDAAFLVLFALMLAPWLSYLISEVTLPGGAGVKFRARIERQMDLLQGEIVGGVDSAGRLVEAEIAALRSDIEALRAATATKVDRISGEEARSKIDQLAQDYESIRTNMTRGTERTERMTRVVGEMIAAIESARDLDLGEYIGNTNRGKRLAGYAYQYVRPAAHQLLALVSSITGDRQRETEDQDRPFGQYWGLRALRKVAEKARERGEDLDQNTVRQLQDFLTLLPVQSDRAYELRRTLEEHRQ